MQLSLQLSKLQGTTSYFDGNMGRVGVKSDTVSQLQSVQDLNFRLGIQTRSLHCADYHIPYARHHNPLLNTTHHLDRQK